MKAWLVASLVVSSGCSLLYDPGELRPAVDAGGDGAVTADARADRDRGDAAPFVDAAPAPPVDAAPVPVADAAPPPADAEPPPAGPDAGGDDCDEDGDHHHHHHDGHDHDDCDD